MRRSGPASPLDGPSLNVTSLSARLGLMSSGAPVDPDATLPVGGSSAHGSTHTGVAVPASAGVGPRGPFPSFGRPPVAPAPVASRAARVAELADVERVRNVIAGLRHRVGLSVGSLRQMLSPPRVGAASSTDGGSVASGTSAASGVPLRTAYAGRTPLPPTMPPGMSVMRNLRVEMEAVPPAPAVDAPPATTGGVGAGDWAGAFDTDSGGTGASVPPSAAAVLPGGRPREAVDAAGTGWLGAGCGATRTTGLLPRYVPPFPAEHIAAHPTGTLPLGEDDRLSMDFRDDVTEAASRRTPSGQSLAGSTHGSHPGGSVPGAPVDTGATALPGLDASALLHHLDRRATAAERLLHAMAVKLQQPAPSSPRQDTARGAKIKPPESYKLVGKGGKRNATSFDPKEVASFLKETDAIAAGNLSSLQGQLRICDHIQGLGDFLLGKLARGSGIADFSKGNNVHMYVALLKYIAMPPGQTFMMHLRSIPYPHAGTSASPHERAETLVASFKTVCEEISFLEFRTVYSPPAAQVSQNDMVQRYLMDKAPESSRPHVRDMLESIEHLATLAVETNSASDAAILFLERRPGSLGLYDLLDILEDVLLHRGANHGINLDPDLVFSAFPSREKRGQPDHDRPGPGTGGRTGAGSGGNSSSSSSSKAGGAGGAAPAPAGKDKEPDPPRERDPLARKGKLSGPVCPHHPHGVHSKAECDKDCVLLSHQAKEGKRTHCNYKCKPQGGDPDSTSPPGSSPAGGSPLGGKKPMNGGRVAAVIPEETEP